MKIAEDYLKRTDSAVRHLFDAVGNYIGIMKLGIHPIFVSGLPPGPEQDAQYAAWRIEHAEELAEAKIARQAYREERFALDTICGAILQIAGKGLEIYSENTKIPDAWKDRITPKLAKFAVGREVRNVPLGLVVYASRNQHTHFNDRELHSVSARIFESLAAAHGLDSATRDPAFDLANAALDSYASNVTALINWRDFLQYQQDMRCMLGIQS